MKIRKNPDEEYFNMARVALNKNDGYCPCALEKTEDVKCPCQEFLEIDEEGLCYCGLYEKISNN